MVHVAPMARVDGEIGQLLPSVYWLALPPPFSPIEVICITAVPMFFKVEVIGALLEPTLVFGKAMVAGFKLTSGASTPEPLNGTDCGLPAALSVTVSAAVRVPAAEGVNVTWKLQAAEPVRSAGQLLVCV